MYMYYVVLGEIEVTVDFVCFFFFNQKTAYELRISDWSSDVCSSDLTGKRPLMAEVAERLADGAVVTDDNPRNEAPEQILEGIRSGFSNPAAVTFSHGRAQAIASVIAAARAEDVVVLAGKGHEDYQEVRGERLPFSDLEEACRALSVWAQANA